MNSIDKNKARLVCLGCAILLFTISGLAENAFTIYQTYIMTVNNFTNAQTSTLLTCRNFATLVSMLFVNLYYRKLSMRTGMTIAGFTVVASYVVFGFAGNYEMYCLGAVLTGIAYGLGTMIPIGILLEAWFTENRNTAIGICSAATGLSTLGIPSLISYSVENKGLSFTFLCEAAVLSVLVTTACLLIRNPPDKRVINTTGNSDADSKKQRIDIKSMLVIIPAIFLVGGAMNVAFVHQSVLITGEGFSPSVAALASSVSGIAIVIGKLLFGRLGDRIGNYKSNYIFGSIMFAGLVLFSFISASKLFVYIASGVFSAGIAFTSVGLTVWAVDLSDKVQTAKYIQLFQIIYALGTFALSSFPGIVADKMNGSYRVAYAVFALMTAYILFAVQYSYRVKQKTDANKQ